MTKPYCNPSPSAAELASEVWLASPLTGGAYEVSSLGRVAMAGRGTGRRLRSQTVRNKYLGVNLSVSGGPHTLRVHLMVADAFHGARPSGYQANHKDGNRLNNRASNLEWVTPEENRRHYETVLLPARGGYSASNGIFRRGHLPHSAKLNPAAVLEIRRRRASGESGTKLAAEYGVSNPTIYNICNGRIWSRVTDSPAAEQPGHMT